MGTESTTKVGRRDRSVVLLFQARTGSKTGYIRIHSLHCNVQTCNRTHNTCNTNEHCILYRRPRPTNPATALAPPCSNAPYGSEPLSSSPTSPYCSCSCWKSSFRCAGVARERSTGSPLGVLPLARAVAARGACALVAGLGAGFLAATSTRPFEQQPAAPASAASPARRRPRRPPPPQLQPRRRTVAR